jgi:hypothetical protein
MIKTDIYPTRYTAPDEARTQQNARLRAASIEEAMTLADAWIAERCS